MNFQRLDDKRSSFRVPYFSTASYTNGTTKWRGRNRKRWSGWHVSNDKGII